MKQTILCVALMAAVSLSAQAQLINIQFGGNDYNSQTPTPVQTGVGIVGSPGDKWNDFTSDADLLSGVGLNYSTGASSGATLTVAGTGGGYTDYSGAYPVSYPIYQYSDIEDGNAGGDTFSNPSLYNLAGSELGASSTVTLSFTHLADNTSYSIYLLSAPDNWSRKSSWAVNGGTALDVGPLNAYTGPYQSTYGAPTVLVLGTNYLVLSGTTDASGDLTIKGTGISGDPDINGLQLVAAVPEPSTYALMLTGILGILAFRFKRCLKA